MKMIAGVMLTTANLARFGGVSSQWRQFHPGSIFETGRVDPFPQISGVGPTDCPASCNASVVLSTALWASAEGDQGDAQGGGELD